MTEVAPHHTRDDPEAYIPRDRRRALAGTREMPDRVTGAALFADISGFTPLTEALADELGSQRGAEELTANLGRVFHAVIDELDAAAATSSTSRATPSPAGSTATTASGRPRPPSRCRTRWRATGRSTRPAARPSSSR